MAEKMKLKELKETLAHMEYYNNMAPFPVYSTELVNDLKDFIKMCEKGKKEIYDDLPVASCKHCLSLFVIVDEQGNDICGRCGSVNEIEIYNNVQEYLDNKNKINNSY